MPSPVLAMVAMAPPPTLLVSHQAQQLVDHSFHQKRPAGGRERKYLRPSFLTPSMIL